MKISYRRIIFLLLTFGILFLVIFLLITAEIFMRSSFRRNLINRAELLANTFMESSLPFFLYYDWEELQRIAKNIGHKELVSLLILDRENVIRVSSEDENWIGQKYSIPFSPSSLQTGISKKYILFKDNKKIPAIDVYVPIRVKSSSQSWGTILLTFSTESIEKGLTKARLSFIILGILLIAIMSILNRWIASEIAKPVRMLSEHLTEISKGNYEKRVPPIQIEEFEELVKSVNSMAENLGKREKELRDAKDFLEEKVKERTEELRRSEEKYRDFFERAGEAILVINSSTMKIEEANEMAEKILLCKENLEGKLFLSLDTEKNSLKEIIEETIKKGSSYSSKIELRRFDGTIIPVEISTKLIGSNLIHVIFRDITEKEKIEKLIIESERWKAMAELSEGIVHNFNNLLTIISGRAHLIKDSVKEQKILKNLETIEKMVKEGIKITGRLMEFTQRKGNEIKAQSIDINSLILDIVELTKPRWKDMAETEGKEIKILTNLGNIPLIKGNRVELESAILNVIYNSIEAIENKGTIQISTYFKEQKVFIEVKDTGKGIEPENIGKVFDPFFTTKGTIGTGFGLTISYNNVKKHGGEIEIESEKGKGTKITITLPIF
jgi:PAS domain S-box-containing protein